MKNCIILGSGRSGTSMLAGTLAQSGYFMGDNLYPARESNPKGFFEDPFINGINEQILSKVRFGLKEWGKRLLSGRHFSDGQRWLEIMPEGSKFCSSNFIDEQIVAAVSKAPFCYKDPRFSYTLPLWRKFLKEAVFICVFREPSLTAFSIVKECNDMEYLHSLPMSFEYALEVWYHVYINILKTHMQQGEWLFIHYDQVLSEDGISKIEAITDAIADKTFPDRNYKRTTSEVAVEQKYNVVYSRLCELAGYNL